MNSIVLVGGSSEDAKTMRAQEGVLGPGQCRQGQADTGELLGQYSCLQTAREK